MFNNVEQSILIDNLKINFSEDIIENILTTLQYYNLTTRIDNKLLLNKSFFTKKQEIKVELIKKSDIKEQKDNEQIVSSINLQIEAIECMILKIIKINKIQTNDIFDVVSNKCNFKFDLEIFNKCMKRLFDLDYYEIQDNLIVYVP